jgi:ATP-dependent Clp protease protease subunit
MLRDYSGKGTSPRVTVKIDGIAASAASVIAMAGDEVLMSPLSLLMIHDPGTIAIGDSEEMHKTIDMLAEIKEAIINAYQEKSGLSRKKIAEMMSSETWMNAKKAIELGFADGILFENEEQKDESEGLIFSRMAVTNSILEKLKIKSQIKFADENLKKDQTNPQTGCINLPLESLYKRLNLLKY